MTQKRVLLIYGDDIHIARNVSVFSSFYNNAMEETEWLIREGILDECPSSVYVTDIGEDWEKDKKLGPRGAEFVLYTEISVRADLVSKKIIDKE